MPQPPDWKRVLETGMQFTELRRSQAHRLAADLVAQGQLARDQVGAAVDELIEISRNRSEELRALISSEVQRQLGVLGLATKNDLAALERRLLRSTSAAKPAAKQPAAKPAKSPAAKKARAAAKAPAKSAAAQKALAKKAAAKKAAAKKAPAKKPASKQIAKRSATKRTATKRAGARPAGRAPAAKRAR